jgi:hypothetical protein
VRWVRCWAWILAASATLLLPGTALCRVPTRLVYARAQSAKDCPDEQALVAAVAARLGYDAFSPWGDQTILANVSRIGTTVLGRAELIDHDGIAQGSREVKVAGGDCNELILALSLAISITLDPLHADPPPPAPLPEASLAAQDPPDVEAPPEVDVPAPAVVAKPRDVPRAVASPSVTSASWHASGGALTAYALASRVTFGARLGFEARRARWSLGLEGWTALPAAWDIEGGGQLRASLWAGAVVPCFETWTGLRLCGLVSVGSLRTESSAISSPRSERVLHTTAGGRLSFSWPVGQRLELMANADVGIVLNRPRFQLDQAEVWRPSPALALLGIGATVRFF